MVQDLKLQLDKLTNQVRFVQMIIKKELSVSGRKKLDVIRDLKSKGFTSFPKVAKPAAEAGEPEEAAEEDDDSGSDNGYDYLLSVLSWAMIC
jgi:DNA topoisomerase II